MDDFEILLCEAQQLVSSIAIIIQHCLQCCSNAEVRAAADAAGNKFGPSAVQCAAVRCTAGYKYPAGE
jgi:hypothetical protein